MFLCFCIKNLSEVLYSECHVLPKQQFFRLENCQQTVSIFVFTTDEEFY